MCFFEPYKTGYLLRIKLTPGASVCGFRDVFNDEKNEAFLKAYVNVVPEKGKANKELIKMLSKELKIAKSLMEIVGGETDHYKKIFINVEQSEEMSLKLALLKKG